MTTSRGSCPHQPGRRIAQCLVVREPGSVGVDVSVHAVLLPGVEVRHQLLAGGTRLQTQRVAGQVGGEGELAPDGRWDEEVRSPERRRPARRRARARGPRGCPSHRSFNTRRRGQCRQFADHNRPCVAEGVDQLEVRPCGESRRVAPNPTSSRTPRARAGRGSRGRRGRRSRGWRARVQGRVEVGAITAAGARGRPAPPRRRGRRLGHRQVGDGRERQAAARGHTRVRRHEQGEVAPGRVADDHRLTGPTTTRGAAARAARMSARPSSGLAGNPRVLRQDRRVAERRECGGHRAQVGPVVLGSPEAPMDQEDRGAGPDVVEGPGQVDVGHLVGSRSVGPRAVRSGRSPVEHTAVLGHEWSMAIDLH